VARIRFLHSDRSQLDHVLGCCEANPAAQQAFADLFQPVALGSDASLKLTRENARHQQLEARCREHREPPLLDPPPEQLVNACLERFENGDLNGWWTLNCTF